MSVNVDTTTTVDFGDLGGRLLDAERRVLARYGRVFLSGFREGWSGWVYAGRPAKAPRNVSKQAWRTTLESRRGKGTLIISNRARGYASKEPYVGYVHRAGSTAIEWEKAWKELRAAHLPGLARDLGMEIAKAMMKKRPPVKIRTPRADTAVVAEALVL